MKKKFSRNIVLFLFVFVVIASKIIRYTVMQSVLVDEGIGYYMINYIVDKIYRFQIYGLTATQNASAIFTLLNILELTTYSSFEVYITIIWNAILILIILKTKKSYTLMETLFLLCSIAILNIFDFCLAKEPVQMLYFILIFLILISNMSLNMKRGLSILVILFSALSFRKYYILIAFFMIVMEVLCNLFAKKKSNIITILKILFLVCIIYFVFLNFAKVLFPSGYQDLIKYRIAESSAKSDITTLFENSDTNIAVFCVDYILVVIRIMLPLELLPLGIKYIPYVIYQLIITFFVIKSFRKVKEKNKTRNLALYIYLGFMLCSAAFEPDFGSWVRHEAVVFPVILILSDFINLDKKENFEEVQNIDE